ncbi:MAG: hypothetical protein D6721_05265 [Gammaproteobacteria bacterium]|nr:MAG: hypothetical protein D6721_05265 [Gammaproteobacteria bacterium]
MPLLSIETNAELPAERRTELLRKASRKVAELLGKPERYVLVTLRPNPHMWFAGEAAPVAYLELKSIGLPEGKTAELSAGLCELVSAETGIPSDRIYIEFANAARHLWGWNGGTF